jgi:predicted HD phosphohydrolase
MSVVPASNLDEIFAVLAASSGVFDGVGGDGVGDDGDPIDILQHSLQAADRAAEVAPTDLGLQVAALVHDLGHHVPVADRPVGGHHGSSGAELVRGVMGDVVARLVELHVPAKRYLVATDATYARILSDASTTSLARQGGSMTASERAAFEADPLARRAVALRRCDEAAKIDGRSTTPLDEWHRRTCAWLRGR